LDNSFDETNKKNKLFNKGKKKKQNKTKQKIMKYKSLIHFINHKKFIIKVKIFQTKFKTEKRSLQLQNNETMI